MSRKENDISNKAGATLHNIINGELLIHSKWLQLILQHHWKVLEDS